MLEMVLTGRPNGATMSYSVLVPTTTDMHTTPAAIQSAWRDCSCARAAQCTWLPAAASCARRLGNHVPWRGGGPWRSLKGRPAGAGAGGGGGGGREEARRRA
jgi:hypothetical protein